MDKYPFDILDECVINTQQVLKNGQPILNRNGDETPWLTQIYRGIGINYPKFFKMDNLCKAGILATEILLNETAENIPDVRPDWSIILINSASSLDDDRHYQVTIQQPGNYYPSPSVFVYTLANIVTGEIAIRHKIGGESSFYILPAFDRQRWLQIVAMCFRANPETRHLITGWVDYDEEKCDVQLFHIAARAPKKD